MRGPEEPHAAQMALSSGENVGQAACLRSAPCWKETLWYLLGHQMMIYLCQIRAYLDASGVYLFGSPANTLCDRLAARSAYSNTNYLNFTVSKTSTFARLPSDFFTALRTARASHYRRSAPRARQCGNIKLMFPRNQRVHTINLRREK